MVLDIPTLSVAVMVVMSLTSSVLVAHWLVNRSVQGMGGVALGLVSSSIGAFLAFVNAETGAEYWVLAGYFLILLGHMWFWLGFADFWQARTSALVLATKTTLGGAWLALLYLQFSGSDISQKIALVAFVSGLFSLGCVYTISQALGGSLGLYKGIIRRTSIGAALAAVLFSLHGLYAIFHAAVRGGALPYFDAAGFPALQGITQLEIIVFSISFSLIVIIVTTERLQAELKIQEMLDPLTRALNRRAFIEVVKAVMARARRNSEPVSLIMMDIDKFKRINTVHGRAVGDKVLKQFAALVTEGRRAQDVFCRFGGEEFVFLLPGTPEEGTGLVAQRIRRKIENAVFAPDGMSVKLTVAMGVITERGDDLDADGMLDVVDRRMHKAQALQFERIESA